MNIIEQLESTEIAKWNAERPVPDFKAGDTVRVNVKVVEGSRERVQAFEGVCIARTNRGINSAFTVRKISNGEGVERVFPVYSTRVAGIEVVRYGSVRRAKLYYLRERSGRSARITEDATRRIAAREKAREAAGENPNKKKTRGKKKAAAEKAK